MKYLKSLKKLNPFVSVASEGLVSDVISYIDTGSYLFNAQISRSIFNGIPANRIVIFAGPPSAGKTYLTLTVLKSFLLNHPENVVLYYDTENAIETRQLKSMDIATDRFYHIPIKTLEDFKLQSSTILSEIRKDRESKKDNESSGNVYIVLDSLGMAASSKEIEDSLDGKNKADMGVRGKLIRSIFRILTLELGLLQIPMICTTHTYESLTPYKPTGLSGGLGPQFSGSIVIELTVKKDYNKLTKNVNGIIITSNLRKSRLSKQNTKVQLKLSYGGGLDKYYGLVDFCLDHGIFKKDGRKILIGNDRVYKEEIEKEPTKFFTDDILNQIDQITQEYFDYGFDSDVTIDDVKTGKESVDDANLDDIELDDFDEKDLDDIDAEEEL